MTVGNRRTSSEHDAEAPFDLEPAPMTSPQTRPQSTRACSSCGGQVPFDRSALSARCPYCDSPNIDVERAHACVDLVAPFRIERRVACNRLREWLDDRWFAPEQLRKLRVEDRALEGLMVPAWAIDGISESRWHARVGIVWYRTETYTDSEGKRRTRTVREVEWFPASGGAVDQFEDHLSHAGGPISVEDFRRLPPFDLGFARPFDERWVSGFVAHAPDRPGAVPREQVEAERRELARRRVEQELLPGDENRLTSIDTQVEIHDTERVLLPLWRVQVSHEGKPVVLWVHGQTGACLGEVPTSVRKVMGVIGLALLVIATALYFGGAFS